MFTTLEITRCQGIATLWMNRPEVHNAFNAVLISELEAACRLLEADPDVRIVVLAGRGKNFSAGADLNWMKAAGMADAETNLEDARRLASMFRTLAEMSKPTVARVQGAALGGGMGLAAACDICIASESASFATSEVRLGIVPGVISPYVMRAIGERQASRYFLSAERISASRALSIGLAHEVVPVDRLEAKMDEILSALLAGGPQAQAAAKHLIRAVVNRPVDDALIETSARSIAGLRASAEAREGLDAFLSKRQPGWLSSKELHGV